jgi:hypothetical protein
MYEYKYVYRYVCVYVYMYMIYVNTLKNFRNFGTYLIQLHYILVSFYDFTLYDPVLLEPNSVVKLVVFWSRFTTFHFTILFCWNLTL